VSLSSGLSSSATVAEAGRGSGGGIDVNGGSEARSLGNQQRQLRFPDKFYGRQLELEQSLAASRVRFHRNRARQAIRRCRKMMKVKRVNGLHKYFLMDAEFTATFIKGKKFAFYRETYDRAITAATKVSKDGYWCLFYIHNPASAPEAKHSPSLSAGRIYAGCGARQ